MPRSGFSPFHDRPLESGASGFSLVELSIVLVILGLLTGGILTGQNLIRAAELRSVITEFKNYQTAVMTFKDKYMALPGDMRNATDFWGAAQAGGACNHTTAGSGTQTCNGNGNGKLANAAALGQYGETFTFWQHLANAGMIEGSYTGMAGTGDVADATPGVNVPNSKLSNAGWSTSYLDNSGVTTNDNFAVNFGNNMIFGKKLTNGAMVDAVLTPEEAWNIDTKVDDGLPAYGFVIATYWDDQCSAADDGSSAADDLTASYKLNDTSVQCALRLKSAY